jgi:RNA polymerase sigma-70 factor (ECF subfamily)
METSDDELIGQCQSGDADAFGVLVRRYAARATQVALGLVGDHADAMDISQEAFVRAWRHIRKFRGRSSFFTWYSSILRKVALTWLHRRWKNTDVDLMDASAVPAGGFDPAVLAERNEQAECLWNTVLHLPTRHREVIVLSHFENLSYKEIAEVLEIPIGTVMSRLHAARKALRKQLTGEGP